MSHLPELQHASSHKRKTCMFGPNKMQYSPTDPTLWPRPPRGILQRKSRDGLQMIVSTACRIRLRVDPHTHCSELMSNPFAVELVVKPRRVSRRAISVLAAWSRHVRVMHGTIERERHARLGSSAARMHDMSYHFC